MVFGPYLTWHTTLKRVAFSLLIVLGAFAAAHEDDLVRYVATSGVDIGHCDDPAHPCQTLTYALEQATKGSEIRVAAGHYTFQPEDPAEVVQLTSYVIPVRGGYSSRDAFSTQAPAENLTVLLGPAPEHAPRLAAQGFLLADPDGLPRSEFTASQAATRFVAEGGLDTGDCLSASAPCGSIAYAVSQAAPGDTVAVAEGSYGLEPGTLDALRAAGLNLQGGFSTDDQFARAEPREHPTYVAGPPFQERDDLAARGLTLVQDRKGLAIEESVRTRALSPAPPTAPSAFTPCDPATGMAGPYPCQSVDLLARIPLGEFSSNPGAANDIWGFVDLNDGREYALIGLVNGTAVVDVTDPLNPVEVGTVTGEEARWRDVKVYQVFSEEEGRWNAYAYVTADFPAAPQGLQIIDLTALPASISLAASTTQFFARAHNLYLANVDYATGQALGGLDPFIYVSGANLSLGGGPTDGVIRVLSLQDPTAPTLRTVLPATAQYSHDVTSLVLTDARTQACRSGGSPPPGGHNPCELLVDFNEDTVELWDVTDKTGPLLLGSVSYPDTGYTHSGWWSEDKTKIFIQDELDEQAGLNTTLRTLDISDLSSPFISNTWAGPTRAIDHNGFTKGGRYYMSNYRRGLTILDVRNADAPQQLAFFDTFPTPSDNSASFNGAWGTYPYLPSGTLLVSDIENGLFLLRESAVQTERATYQYAAKVVCGFQEELEDARLARGLYATSINILNPWPDTVRFTKRLALTFPPGDQEPGEVLPIAEDALDPGQALAVDCPDLRRRLFPNGFPAPYIEGFVVIESPLELDVTAVYSSGPLDEPNSSSLDIERVEPRLVRSQ